MPPARQRRRDWVPWLLAGVGILFFSRPLLLGETFYTRDIHLLYLGAKSLLGTLWRHGEAALWNPFLHTGLPLAGDPAMSAFYPPTLLYALLPVHRALSLELAAHAIVSSLAAYALARSLRFSRPAAWLTGIGYAFAGVALSQLDLHPRMLALPYLPAALTTFHRWLRDGDLRSLAFTALLGGLQALGGAPESVMFTWVTLAVWGAAYPYTVGAWPRLLRFAAAAALALGIGMVQVLAQAEMLGQSTRGAGVAPAAFTEWSVPWRRLPELLVPGYLGPRDGFADSSYWGSEIIDQQFPYQTSIYFGIPLLLLAAIGAAFRSALPRRSAGALLALAAGALVFSLGGQLPGFERLYVLVPPMRVFRFPEKVVLLAALPLALLAGNGLHRLQRGEGRGARRALVVAAAATCLLCALAAIAVRHGAENGLLELLLRRSEPAIAQGVSGALAWAAGLAAALAALSWLGTSRGAAAAPPVAEPSASARTRRLWTPWLLAGVATVDLLVAGRAVNPVVPAPWFLKTPRLLPAVAAAVGDGRLFRELDITVPATVPVEADLAWTAWRKRQILADYEAAWVGVPLAYHVDFHGLAPVRSARLSKIVDRLPWERRVPLLSAAAVRAVVAVPGAAPPLRPIRPLPDPGGAPLVLYANDAAAPRFRWIGIWHSAHSEQEALQAVLARGFDPRRHAVVEDPARSDSPGACPTPGRVEVQRATHASVTLEVESACPGYLVIADSFYPGWTHQVDGHSATAVRADYAFTAVALPAGRHSVERRYRPRWLMPGLAISGLSLVATVLMAAGGSPFRR